MGEVGQIVNEARCSILDALQHFGHRGWKSSQEGITVQAGDDQCMDQESCHIFCEERPDPADVVEGKSAGLGHSSDVWGAEESVVENYAQVPHHQRRHPRQ